jgi:PAS domain S-box-containing protein
VTDPALATLALAAARAPVGIFHLDAAGRPDFVNDALREMTGLDLEALAEHGWLAAVHPEDRERVEAEAGRARADGVAFRAEHRILSPGGRVTWVLLATEPLRDASGALVGTVGVVTDVGARRGLEERLARSERLAAVGTLAAGTAHALNSPLAAVIAGAGFALERARGLGPSGQDLVEALEDVLAAARGAAATVRSLGDSARAAPRPSGPVDLRAVARAAADAAGPALSRRAAFWTDLGAVPGVLADAADLVACVGALLDNAAAAVADAPRPAHEVRLATRTAATGEAVLEVTDTGPGVPEAIRARIFDPFFTTRPGGGAAGLGLSAVHGIVTAAGGRVEAESQEGKGAVFRLVFPPAPGR